MRNRTSTTLSLISLAFLGCAGEVGTGEVSAEIRVRQPTLTPQQSGTTNRLQAVSPVNRHVVWASGVGGTYAVTTHGGATWRAGVGPGAGGLVAVLGLAALLTGLAAAITRV